MSDPATNEPRTPVAEDEAHYCTFHPKVQTEVRCAECERYICTRDMVVTPVGYKCKQCSKPARSQYVLVKPGQMVRAIVVGLAMALVCGAALALAPFGGLFVGIIWGAGTAEAVRWGSGGHRTWDVGIVSLVSIGLAAGIATFFAGPPVLSAIVAVVVALSDLALIGRR